MSSGAQIAEQMRRKMADNLMKTFSSKDAVVQRRKLVNYLAGVVFGSNKKSQVIKK